MNVRILARNSMFAGLAVASILTGMIAEPSRATSQCFDYQPPTLTATIPVAASSGLFFDEPFLYAISEDDSLFVIDLTDVGDPEVVGRAQAGRAVWHTVRVNGDLLTFQNANTAVATIIDISDPSHPTVLESLYDDCCLHFDIVVENGFAYVSASDSLLIWDVSDPLEPKRRKGVPGYPGLITAGDGNLYASQYSNTFLVYSLKAPAQPELIATVKTDEDEFIDHQWIEYEQGRLYLTSWSTGSDLLITYDVSDPAQPISLGAEAFLGGFYFRALNRRVLGSHRLVDVTHPENPAVLGEFWGAYPVALSHNLVFRGTDDEIEIYSYQQQGSTYEDPQPFARVAVEGDAVALQGESTLYLGTIAGDSILIRSETEVGSFSDLDLQGDQLFVGTWGDSARILGFDVSDPDAPILISETNFARPGKLARSGDYLAVASDSTVHLLDLTDPASPVPLSVIEEPADVRDVALQDGWLWYTTRDFLHVAVIEDPASPQLLDPIPLPGAGAIVCDSERAFASSGGGVSVFEVLNDEPALVGEFDGPPASQMALGPDVLVYATSCCGLRLVDIRNPQEPSLLGAFSTPEGYGYVGFGDSIVACSSYGPTSLYAIPCGATTQVDFEPSEHEPVRERVNSSLSCWPNPFQNELHLRLEPGTPAPSAIELVDVSGRVVASAPPQELRSGTFRWDALAETQRSLPAGWYVLVARFLDREEAIPVLRVK